MRLDHSILRVYTLLTKKLANNHMYKIFGEYSVEETPVPIPNTAVKLYSADGTALATVWESRTSPKFNLKSLSDGQAFFI